jgi:hypothetical protein
MAQNIFFVYEVVRGKADSTGTSSWCGCKQGAEIFEVLMLRAMF